MIEIAKISFPLAPNALSETQQKELGRKLYKYERRGFEEVTRLANEVYEAVATSGDAGFALNQLIAVYTVEVDSDFERFMRGFTAGWLLIAAAKGVEAHDRDSRMKKMEAALWS